MFLLLLSTPIVQQAQNSNQPNPFELIHRLDKEQQLAIIAPKGNPFNISKPAESLLNTQKEIDKYSDGNTIIRVSRYDGDKDISRNWLLTIVLPLILFLTFTATLFRDKMRTILKSFTSSSTLNLAYRESIGRSNIHNVFFYSLSIISYAVFGLILAMDKFINSENFILALTISLILSSSYILLKLGLIFFIKVVFPKKRIMDFYQFNFGLFNHWLGFVLIPFSIFIAFSPQGAAWVISIIAFIIIGIWWIVRIIRGLQIGSKFISVNIFRFFAYLCTVEIAPVIILLTTLKPILGI